MEYRRIGKAGIKISEVALGSWLTFGKRVDDAQTGLIVKTAVDHGVNFIDIADVYARGEAEKAVGRAIKGMRRSDLVISSKLFWPMTDNVNDRGLSRKHIAESIDKSLARIGTDYLDLYFCHRSDPETEIEETVRAMEDLIRQGKILYWGTSVWSPEQINEAVAQASKWRAYPPVVEQPAYNMIDRHIEEGIIETCRAHGMGLTVWSPLAQGLLTGKYNNGIPEGSRGVADEWLQKDITEANLAKIRKLAEIAESLGITTGQLALAWILRLPEISCVITGATRVAQLEENVRASGITLETETIARIEKILSNAPM